MPPPFGNILEWLPQLVLNTGDLRLTAYTPEAARIDVQMTLDRDRTLLTVAHPQVGRLQFSPTGLELLSATGKVFKDVSASTSGPTISSIRTGLRPDYGWLSDALSLTSSTVAEIQVAVKQLSGLSADVTLLVLPGASAFATEVGPLQLGALEIPRISADVSLRSVAMDLSRGCVAFELSILNAKGHGPLRLAQRGLEWAFHDPTLALSVEAVYDLGQRRASVFVRFMRCAGRDFEGSVLSAGATPERLAITGSDVAVSLRNALFEQPPGQEFEAVCGDLALHLPKTAVSADTLLIGTGVRVTDLVAEAHELVARISLGGSGSGLRYEGNIRATRIDFKLKDIELSSLPPGFLVELGAMIGTDDHYTAAGWEFSLPAFQPTAGFVGFHRQLTKAVFPIGGLTLEAATATNRIRVTTEYSDLDQQIGVQAYIEKATLKLPGNTIPVDRLTLDRSETRFAPAVPETLNSLKSRAVNQMSVVIGSFDIKTVGKEEIRQSLQSVDVQLLRLLLNMLQEKGVPTGALGDAIMFVASFLSDPISMSAQLVGLLTFGLVRVEDLGILIRLGAGAVSFDADYSADSVIAFRVKRTIEDLGGWARVSYPEPHLDDLKHRGTATGDAVFHLGLELEFVVRIRLGINGTTRRITLDALDVLIPIQGVDPNIVVGLHKLVLAWFGYEQIKNQIVDGLKISVPLELPDAWDVTRLTIDKAEKAIKLSFRAVEHVFVPV